MFMQNYFFLYRNDQFTQIAHITFFPSHFLLLFLQSVGKSLTFRGAAFEASELLKTHRCKDPICDTHLWKVKHELDMARMKMKSLEAQLQQKGIQSPLLKNNSVESGIDSKNSSSGDIDQKQTLLQETSIQTNSGSHLPHQEHNQLERYKFINQKVNIFRTYK